VTRQLDYVDRNLFLNRHRVFHVGPRALFVPRHCCPSHYVEDHAVLLQTGANNAAISTERPARHLAVTGNPQKGARRQ